MLINANQIIARAKLSTRETIDCFDFLDMLQKRIKENLNSIVIGITIMEQAEICRIIVLNGGTILYSHDRLPIVICKVLKHWKFRCPRSLVSGTPLCKRSYYILTRGNANG